jgi:hypothetical protein
MGLDGAPITGAQAERALFHLESRDPAGQLEKRGLLRADHERGDLPAIARGRTLTTVAEVWV